MERVLDVVTFGLLLAYCFSKGNDETENLVAVMGVTGSGKSTFINLVLGKQLAAVGHTLQAETSEIATYPVKIGQRNVVLIDTPGFDDTNRSDTEVLRMLCSWLVTSYEAGRKLSSVIYLQRITDKRIGGSAIRSINSFRQLCGPDFYRNIVLATTFWSRAESSSEIRQYALRNETELRTTEGFWKDMIAGGAQMCRLSEEQTEARRLILETCNKSIPIALKVQAELVDQKASFENISAARAIDPEVDRARQEHHRLLQQQNTSHERVMKEREMKVAAEKARMDAQLQESRRRQAAAEKRRKVAEEVEEKRLATIRKAQQEAEEEQQQLNRQLAQLRIDRARDART